MASRADGLQDLEVASGYNSADADLVSSFYVPCLEVATKYDRAVGYFRSSVYLLVGVALSDFALRAGRMRLVCSPSLNERDLETMRNVISQPKVIDESLLAEIEGILRQPDNRPVVELLATLIRFGALEIRIAFRPGQAGIYHEKLGIFQTEADQLSFTGSSNETFLAWDVDGNHEGFETFGSWDAGDGRRRKTRIQSSRTRFGVDLKPCPPSSRSGLGARAPELPHSEREGWACSSRWVASSAWASEYARDAVAARGSKG